MGKRLMNGRDSGGLPLAWVGGDAVRTHGISHDSRAAVLGCWKAQCFNMVDRAGGGEGRGKGRRCGGGWRANVKCNVRSQLATLGPSVYSAR